jgi:putative FmdB family regulatory protein
MPTYEFACEPCQIRFERRCKIDERKSQRCPECQASVEQKPTRTQVIVSSHHRATNSGASHTADGRRIGNAPPNLSNVDTSALPFVGQDGKLYSADGGQVLKG